MEKNENGLSEMLITPKRQLAMVYSPMQCWRMLIEPDKALGMGTIFEELYKPLEEECQ